MTRHALTTRPLAVVVSGNHLDHPEGRSILRGIHAVCLEHGWSLQNYGPTALALTIQQWQPEVVILVMDDGSNSPTELLRGRIVVSAGEDLTRRGWPSVVPDDAEAGRQAARHLLDRGLRSLAAFGYWQDSTGKPENAWAIRRADGFAEAAHGAGAAISRFGERIDPATGRSERPLPENIRRWMAELPMPVGILACCDPWATLPLIFCRGLGFRVPEDIAIVGVNDDRTRCEIADPPLSSVAIPWERLGQIAAELAGNAIAGQPPPLGPILVPPVGVTVRRSSDTLAVGDPDVAAALAMILAHANRPLTVAQILRRVPLTQRSLERNFKRLVGRRMTGEIRRVHVEQAKPLLAGSDMAMPAIARRCGFTSATKLGIAFRQETGFTPSEFRRLHGLGSDR